MTTKRSFVEAFLEEEAREENASKRSTRIALARAKNKQDTSYQNLKKTKERAKKIMEKMREYQTAYEMACADVKKLKNILKED